MHAREFDPEAFRASNPPKHMKLTRPQTTTIAVILAVAFPVSVFGQKKNILIVTVDRNVEETKNPIPHIGVDNTAQGRGVSR